MTLTVKANGQKATPFDTRSPICGENESLLDYSVCLVRIKYRVAQ